MWYLYAIVLIAGIANAVEPGQNTTLAKGLHQTFAAGLICAIVTAATILAVGLATKRFELPGVTEASRVPWWAWFGGVMGGGIVIAQLEVAQQIGAGAFLGLLVTAGVVTSILLDHFGLVGFEVHPASVWRILGGLLMIAGVGLVAKF